MPPGLLLRTMRERVRERVLGPDVRFTHLDAVPDQGNLTVLRSRHEVIDAGEKLSNCAAMYAPAVARGECTLVALRSKTGKILALGRLSSRTRGWAEVSEFANQRPSADTMRQFKEYSEWVVDHLRRVA